MPRGLLVRIDREVNKDTELHPLVRWQFQGGLDEDERRAFLFTNVVGADGRRFDMPVAVGALSASAQIYAIGMGRAGRGYRPGWNEADRASGAAGHGHGAAVPGGGDHRRRSQRRGQGARGAAGAGVDAGLRCRALSHRDALHHQGPRNRRAQHGHLSRPAQSDRPARRAHGVAHRRRRRLSALAEIPRPQRADAVRHRRRMRAGGGVHRPAEARRRAGRDGSRGRSRRAADPHRQGGDRSTSRCPPTPRS